MTQYDRLHGYVRDLKEKGVTGDTEIPIGLLEKGLINSFGVSRKTAQMYIKALSDFDLMEYSGNIWRLKVHHPVANNIPKSKIVVDPVRQLPTLEKGEYPSNVKIVPKCVGKSIGEMVKDLELRIEKLEKKERGV